MKLYITAGSPYARIVRALIIEKGLESRVEILHARTREAGSPYYAINPSGRGPYLGRDDGVALEESALICAYLDHLFGRPAFDPPTSGEARWNALRLEALARSTIDGLAVWIRELRRPQPAHQRLTRKPPPGDGRGRSPQKMFAIFTLAPT